MTFTQVKKFPTKRGALGSEIVQGYFKEFMKLGIKAAKIAYDADEYSNFHSAYNCLHYAARKWEFPVRVSACKGEIYFIRTDM